MFQTSKQIKYLLGLEICAVVAIIVAGNFLYWNIQKQSKDVKDAETAIAVLDQKERDLANARQGLETMRLQMERLDQSFLNNDSFVGFLKLLEETARRSSVTFQAQSASLPRNKSDKADISFTISGEYGAIVNFLSFLDELSYSGIVDSVNIIPSSAKGSALNARVHYVIFNFKPQQ